MKKAKVSKYGQWKYPGQDTIIPNANGSITMKGVPYPVLGIDDRGNRKLMMPGGEYQFPGNSVYEIPMMAAGGIVNPCPPGKVPDGKGNCVDDLTTPPIPSSSLYPYYTDQLAKAKSNPKITNPDALVGQMIRCKRDGSCKTGEEWKEEEKITKVPPEPGPKEHYTIKDSGNPGHSYLWKYTDDGNSGYNQELIGSVFNRDFLNDEQQVQFDAPGGGTAVVNYDPNIQKVYSDQRDVWQTIEDERGVKQNAQNNLNREQQRIKEENAARELWEKQQREKQNKRIAPPKDVAIPPGGFAMGGELDHGKVAGRSRTKANNKNYVLNQTFYEDGFIDNNSRRTLKGFITGAPKPGEPGTPAKLAMGGAKNVKIKSLPKAQSGPSSSGLTPEQQQNYEDRYLVYRDQGDSTKDANNLAFNDASYFNTDPVLNFQSFLPNPDSGVRVASGKRFPYKNIDPKTFDPWEENYMSDPEYVARYNKMDSDQQERLKNYVYDHEDLDTYNYNLDKVKKWEKNWYSQRATLPQFTDIANKRLSLVENINIQPYGNVNEYQNVLPGSGGVFVPSENTIKIPSTSFSYPSLFAHERSHWYDWNAPQNDDMYNGSYLRSYTKGTIPNPVYNDEDLILNNIIPGEYKMPYGVADPLRLGENDTTTYDTETEKIEANMPKASDDIRSNTVKIPFKGQEMMFGNTRNNIDYFYNPTEVRARLNEWRFQHNIDPTKDYSNEELQQIIDKDLKDNKSGNFDLYKVIQGRGDLLKQINDSYVSTGDKEDPDQMPKAQRGLRKAQDKNKVKKGKTLFGRPYQIVETEAGPDLWGNERPGETTRVKTVYYKNGNIAKQKIDNNENGGDEVTYHDKDGKVTAERTGDGYRTFSNGYFQSTNNVDYETVKRIHDELDRITPKNKLQGFVQRAKLNLENMSRDGSQPGDSYNTVWPDWENDRFNYTREKNPDVRKSRAKFQGGGVPQAQDGTYDYFTASKKLNDEKNRIAQMRNNVIPISLSHSASSDNKPFNIKLPEGQHYCTTRACEIEREAGFPINQVASGYKIMKETTPENGWYPTTYDNLLSGDIAQVVRNNGSGHTMVSTGDAYNMPELWYSPADRDPNLPREKGFFWDNGAGTSFDFEVPPSENELAHWMKDVKKMNYYTYKGNLPQYEKEYSSAVNNYLHDTSEGDAGPMAPIDAIPNKQNGGSPYKIQSSLYRAPNIVRQEGREYYDPMSETIYLQPSYPNYSYEQAVKNHEKAHHLQKLKGKYSTTELWPGPLKEPAIGSTDDMIFPYYNRTTEDAYGIMNAVPKSTLFGIPEDIAVMGFQNKTYDTPGTAEYEAEQMVHKKQGGAMKKVKIKSLPKSQTGPGPRSGRGSGFLDGQPSSSNATYQDSLDVANQGQAVMDWYNSQGYYGGTDLSSDYVDVRARGERRTNYSGGQGSYINIGGDDVNRGYHIEIPGGVGDAALNLGNSIHNLVDRDNIAERINSNQFRQYADNNLVILNENAPKALYDRRIKPRTTLELQGTAPGYFSGNADIVNAPIYEKWYSAPWVNLSEEDKRKRIQFGILDGTPYDGWDDPDLADRFPDLIGGGRGSGGTQTYDAETVKNAGLSGYEATQEGAAEYERNNWARKAAEKKKDPNPDTDVVHYMRKVEGRSRGETTYENRKKIAEELGIDNYSGTSKQNIELIKRLKDQKSKKENTSESVAIPEREMRAQIIPNNPINTGIPVESQYPNPVGNSGNPTENYTLHDSGNPGVSYLHYKKNNDDGTYTSKLLGATLTSQWLDDKQQNEFYSPGGGTARVNYNPNVKTYVDVKDAINEFDKVNPQRKKQGGSIRQVRIKSLPKAQITGELKEQALQRDWNRQQATAWDPNQLNGAQEIPTDTPVAVRPMTIGLPPKDAPKKSKEETANDAAKKTNKKAQNDATLWLLDHPEYMLDADGNPVLKSSMEANAPAEYLTEQQKALKDEFIRERNAEPLQQTLGTLGNNPQTAGAAERYANTELAAPLLEKNPRDKYNTRAEWLESFNPQERAIIQASNKSYKFNPNVWTTFARALQTEGNKDSQWQRNLDLTQEEKNRPVTKMDRLGLLAPLVIPAYGAQRLLTGDYENLSDIGSGDTPKPYFGDSGTMRDYYQPQAQAIGNGLWQAALDPLNYIGAGGGNLLGDARLFNLLDGPISKSINEFSALTPNFRAFDPKLQALRNMRGYGAGIGNGVLPSNQDDIFRYLAESENGIDRSYLMGLSDDAYLRQQVIGADLRDPNYRVDQNLLQDWLAQDARINNRIMPPPDEITLNPNGFAQTYANPFNQQEIIDLTRRGSSSAAPSLRERLMGMVTDRVRGLRRVAGDDVPINQVREQFRQFRASTPDGKIAPVNKSLLNKNETKALLKDKSEIDKFEKLSDSEFRDMLISPDGKIKFPEKYTGPKQITKVETKDWVDEFNGNLELLNRIIAENNTSGKEYWVTGITEDGVLQFRTAEGRTSSMHTYITPGKFRGEIQDIADTKYMVDEIPGLQMAGASPIFGNAVRGTGTYKSLNEYLKKLDLGRVKSGMNSQSPFSRPLWENAIKKGDAFGFYASPSTVYGIMKKEGGVKKNKPGFQVLTDANGKYVFVKT